jgi:hypothetical protein
MPDRLPTLSGASAGGPDGLVNDIRSLSGHGSVMRHCVRDVCERRPNVIL